LLIGLFPVVWWFLLAEHCKHGFVKHIYGITYYALLSVVFINIGNHIPSLNHICFGKITKRKIYLNISALCIWLLFVFALFKTEIHYGVNKVEPYSLETVGTINLTEMTVIQDINFSDLKTDEAYLKKIRTILVNLTDDNKSGTLCVEILQDDNILASANISIIDIEPGEWFDIPIGCMLYNKYEYKVRYSVKNADSTEPYLLVQDKSQAVRFNGSLYCDGVIQNGAIANQYEYDDYIISLRVKICIAAIVILILQYWILIIEDKEKLKKVENRYK
ncbi:MAG: hypothetical protein II193_00715, partial [Lachnospiraceae bacterium]|nr:hypothetical protein [Lachnospiraceae bacterium]